MSDKKPVNPFYVLLVILGIIFGITACAYGVMTVNMSTAEGIATHASVPVMQFLSKHGLTVLLVELALLGVACFAAMGTDSYWAKKP
jgi:hypothetical protein